jgi:hypothetical protein
VDGSATFAIQATREGADSIREQIARILESEPFLRAPRMQRFLSFVAEEALAGRSALLKEYTIALTVFKKASDFDSRICPIVRVEAGRLRRLLTQYYSENRSDPIAVEIPLGTYVPAFRRSSHHDEPPEARRRLDVQRLPLAAQQILPATEVAGLSSFQITSPVTVMSCSVGSEGHFPSETSTEQNPDIISTFQQQCTSIATRHGGELIGETCDGLLIRFGSRGQENTAKKSLSAALDIVSSFGDRAPNGSIGVRIGIASGKINSDISEPDSFDELKCSSPLSDETPILAERVLHRSPRNGITMDEESRRMLCATFGLINTGWLEKSRVNEFSCGS